MRTRIASLIAAIAISALPSHFARALDFGPYELSLQADARWVAVDTPYRSFTDAGTGQLRFDENHDGPRLGRLMANFSGPILETLRADVTLNATSDGDAHAIDATEAFLEWRPYPRNALRWRTRVGFFYPPISLENRAVGWQSVYSISPSGINTWIGEEIRTLGVEQSLTLLRAESDRQYDLSAVVGAFGWNDPAGILIFQRGWALHDRQTGLFGGLPRPFRKTAYDERIEFFREFDHRAGYYVGGEFRYGERHVLRGLHYDNRGDPAITVGKESAWLTRFDSLGWRYETPTDTTVIVQGMRGDTAVGASADGRGKMIQDYWSYFLLLSQQFNHHRATIRYDRLSAESVRGADSFNSVQSATAWTFAYLWSIDDRWQLATEMLQIRGSLLQRATQGQSPAGTERSWQLALRYSL